jgi:hypothetical protein
MSKVAMKVGEWYVNTRSHRLYCGLEVPPTTGSVRRFVCYTKAGELCSFTNEGKYYVDGTKSSQDIVRHLPGCTGFDWQEPKIPDGWRRLADEEILTREDMYVTASDGSLTTVFSYDGRSVKDVLANWANKSRMPYAIIRKIEEPKPEPKFKVGDVVYATKPKYCRQSPVWVREMDLLQGEALTVAAIKNETVKIKENIYSFHQDWLSKEPPAAQYRPFANDEEYAPHFDRPVKRARKLGEYVRGAYRILAYDENGVWSRDGNASYEQMFHDGRKFADTNEPFGVKLS